METIANTYGALLLGGLLASLLSGIVLIQTFYYLNNYWTDPARIRMLVLGIWTLDALHTGFIWGSLWDYVVRDYGVTDAIDMIHWTLALSVTATAILTFLVHCFFAHRILRLARNNWYLVGPIVFLAIFRLVCACVTTGEMISLGTFTTFRDQFWWIFTMGLALSSAIDILITGSLFFLLQTSKLDAAGSGLNAVLDTLILYAFETGSLTCAATIVSMICWLTMSTNLIFMGLHFIIGKLYANSILVTLNTRRRLRRVQDSDPSNHNASVYVLDTRGNTGLRFSESLTPASPSKNGKIPAELQINVERSVQYTVEDTRI